MGRGKHVLSERWFKAWWKDRGAAYLENEQRGEEHRLALQKRRPKCQCKAYPWPHRPGGGLCRYPDAPAEIWKGTPGRNRRVGVRHRGLVKELCKRYRWHPVRDRRKIDRWMPRLYIAYCKRYHRVLQAIPSPILLVLGHRRTGR